MSENKEIKRLREKNQQLTAENQELKYVLHDIQAVNDSMREDIEKEVAAECGCVVIEGMQRNAAYQDVVGVLLMNGYTVELEPIEQGRRLRITIKESEV